MQQNIGKMVAERSVAPQPVLDPKCAVKQRIVLLGGMNVRPHLPQSGKRPEFGPRDMGIVIPDESALESGQIGDERRAEYQEAKRGRLEGDRVGPPSRRGLCSLPIWLRLNGSTIASRVPRFPAMRQDIAGEVLRLH